MFLATGGYVPTCIFINKDVPHNTRVLSILFFVINIKMFSVLYEMRKNKTKQNINIYEIITFSIWVFDELTQKSVKYSNYFNLQENESVSLGLSYTLFFLYRGK